MPVRPEQLGGELQRGLAPVYLVAGEETLLVLEAADDIRRAARSAGFSEREVLSVERSFDWNQLYQAGESQSLFAERKIIELRIASGKPGREGAAAITDYLAAADEDNILLIICHKWDSGSRKAKWVSAVAKAGTYVEIWPIKPQELAGWLQRRMRAKGLEPEMDAVRLLAERLEGNLLAAAQEVDKLALLKGGGEINLRDVQQWVSDSARFDVYRLIECILLGQCSTALRIAAGFKATAAPLPLILGALLREVETLQQLLLATARGMAAEAAFRQLGIWRMRQAPLRAALERTSADALQRALLLLAQMDKQVKGRAGGDVWQSLDQLIMTMARQPEGATL